MVSRMTVNIWTVSWTNTSEAPQHYSTVPSGYSTQLWNMAKLYIMKTYNNDVFTQLMVINVIIYTLICKVVYIIFTCLKW